MSSGSSSPERSPPFERRRARLVADLRDKGLHDERVLGAVGRVERHRFVDEALRPRAYQDEALPIGQGQTISQPFTVAYQTMLLGVEDGDRVLEIGTGSGYQAAVLCELGARVFSVERHAPLLKRTRRLLQTLAYRVVTRAGDGTYGWSAYAPFDGIVVTAGAPGVPGPLLEQLRVPEEAPGSEAGGGSPDGGSPDGGSPDGGSPDGGSPDGGSPDGGSPDGGSPDGGSLRGGRLVVPVGDAEGQQMVRITRTGPGTGPGTGAGSYERENFRSFRFVPLIGEAGGHEN